MFSLVIKKAILVKRADEEVTTIPMLGFIKDIVDVDIADPDPIKFSVIINNFFIYPFIFLPIIFFIIFKSF